jgi:hypothetical protein
MNAKFKKRSKTYMVYVLVCPGRVLMTVYDEAGSVVVIKLVYVILEAGAVVQYVVKSVVR